MNQENLSTGAGRRVFLKKSIYFAPALIALGQLSAHGYDHDGHGCGGHGGGHHGGGSVSSLKCNNGWGNGDQCAPGKSLHHNNAENHQDMKKKVNHIGIDTHGGREQDTDDNYAKDKDHDKYSKDDKGFFKFKNS